MDKLNPESAQLLGQNPDQYPKVAASGEGGGVKGRKGRKSGQKGWAYGRVLVRGLRVWLVKWNVEEGFLERDLDLGRDGSLRLL